jgi:hypothetical protein
MAILTEADREFFRNNGYVKVKKVVPKENCDRVIEAIWALLGKNPEDREEWYTPPKGMDTYMSTQKGGWAELFHHQSLWDNRQHPNLYQAFADILGTEKLWVSLDRVAAKFPYREGYDELSNSFIHWDMDTRDLPTPLEKPMGVQGVLLLADTTEDMGGFHCVPSTYRDLESFLASLHKDRPGKRPGFDNQGFGDLQGHEVVPVPGEAGDLIIWDKLLLHGNGVNRSDRIRFAQFVTMDKATPDPHSHPYVQKKIEGWKTNSGFGYDTRNWEANTYDKPAELTPLGRKLLGLDSWFDE